MHILLIHQALVSHNEAGGTRHFELARLLKKKGIDFTIVASDLNYLTGTRVFRKSKMVKKQVLDEVEILRVYTLPLLHKSYLGRLISFISFMLTSTIATLRKSKIDVVFGTSPPLTQVLPSLLISRIKNVPFLMEVRDLWPDFAVELGVIKNPIIIWGARKLENFLYNHADAIIVNSPGFINHIVNTGVDPNKIYLIPNGVDINMFDPKDDGREVRKELDIEDKFVALYAGAHGLANDLQTVLLAAKILEKYDDIVIIFIGDGKEKPNLIRMVEEMNLKNVKFLPPQPKSRIPKYIAASDVCIAILKPIPLFTTTYPNKVFDYMAAGKPTILAINGVIREVIEKANGGVFVPPGNPEALAKAIINYYKNRELMRKHGKNAREYVSRHFYRENQAHKLKDILITLCNKK